MTQECVHCFDQKRQNKDENNRKIEIMKFISVAVKAMAIICTFIFLIVACAMFRKEEDKAFADTSIFCQVEDNAYWTIYYHKGTKVMWIRNKGSFGSNDMEALIDADGNPVIWEE